MGLDRRAFELLFVEQEAPLYNVVFRYVWHREDAAEMVQEAFVRLWKMRARVEPGSAKALVYRIAINLAITRRRWLGLRRFVGLEAATLSTDIPDEAVISGHQTARLRDALARLPSRLRDVVILCELRELSHAEIAEILGVRPGTVGSRRHEALTRLRTILDPPQGKRDVRRQP